MAYELLHNDSLQVMKLMEENSIDACITDPPYGLTHLDSEFNDFSETAKSGGAFSGKKGGGMSFTGQQNKETADFLRPFFVEAFRVLKPGAFCVVFSQGRLLLGVLTALEEAGFEIREQFYWRKPSALPNQQVASKKNSKVQVQTDRVILGPGKVVEPFVVAQKPREGSYADNFIKWGTGLVDRREAITTVFECKSASKEEKEGITHLTVKPLELMRRIVRGFSKPGDLVLDPFNGSGTTGVAAMYEDRDYIGVEISEMFFKQSEARLKKAEAELQETSLPPVVEEVASA